MNNRFLLLGSCCAFVGVAMGAFGAHVLKTMISPELLIVYQTGVTYQMWHAIALICVALIWQRNMSPVLLNCAGWLFFTGIVLFSGSLYLLALLNIKWLGMVTPVGGICFLSAWGLLVISAVRNHSNRGVIHERD